MVSPDVDIHTASTYQDLSFLLLLLLLSLLFGLTQFEDGGHFTVFGHWKSFFISQWAKEGKESSKSKVEEGRGRVEGGGGGKRKGEGGGGGKRKGEGRWRREEGEERTEGGGRRRESGGKTYVIRRGEEEIKCRTNMRA